MPQLQGLIFDLDGTLIDSAPDLLHAINFMLGLHDRRLLEMDELKPMLGDGMLTLMQRALNATGAFEANKEMAYFKEFITQYRAIEPDPAQIYPHVLELLTAYQAAGIKMGVCTNKPTDTTLVLLKKLNLLRFFEFVAGGDTFEVHKPNKHHLLGVIAALKVPKENCVMIGDGKNDVAVSRNADVHCLILTLGYGEDFTSLDAEKLIPHFGAIPAALAAIGFDAPEI